MISPTLYSSGDLAGSYEWATPQSLFQEYNQGLNFDLDVAASPENYKCPQWLGPSALVYPLYLELVLREKLKEDDPRRLPKGTGQQLLRDMGCCSLEQPWHQLGKRAWCNCPYGKMIGDFTEKSVAEIKSGLQSVTLLLPARTDTKWFHRDIVPALKAEDLNFGGPWRRARGFLKFIKGRVSYEVNGETLNPAPFPSMIVHLYGSGGE